MPFGGAGAVGTNAQAYAVIRSGMAEAVVVWRAMNERSEYRLGQVDAASGGCSDMNWAFDRGPLLLCLGNL
jgi:hypothetical protein